MTRESETRVSC